jgi:hypothetical protein
MFLCVQKIECACRPVYVEELFVARGSHSASKAPKSSKPPPKPGSISMVILQSLSLIPNEDRAHLKIETVNHKVAVRHSESPDGATPKRGRHFMSNLIKKGRKIRFKQPSMFRCAKQYCFCRSSCWCQIVDAFTRLVGVCLTAGRERCRK